MRSDEDPNIESVVSLLKQLRHKVDEAEWNGTPVPQAEYAQLKTLNNLHTSGTLWLPKF